MTVSLRKLYETMWEYEVTLIAGERGLERFVTWFSVVESLEVADFLEGEEIIFTSGVALGEINLFTLLKHTYEKHSSGMIISLGPYIHSISQQVIDFCEEKNYPLFTIPWRQRVPALMRSFARQILDSEKASIELSSALKSAISFPKKKERYVNIFNQYGFREEAYYCMAVIELIEQHEGPMVGKVVKVIEDILMSAGDKSFVINAEGVLMVLFSNYTEESRQKVMLKIINGLRTMGQKFYAGMGQNYNNIENISLSYIQAKNVVNLSHKTKMQNMLVNYNELGLYKLLLAIDNQEVTQEYFKSNIGVLVEYDRANRTNYMETLEMYLQNNCSTGDTADQMYVHRNTINYKIKKIEELLECDLSELEVRVNLYVSCLLKHVCR